jgi:hypothetical protein
VNTETPFSKVKGVMAKAALESFHYFMPRFFERIAPLCRAKKQMSQNPA